MVRILRFAKTDVNSNKPAGTQGLSSHQYQLAIYQIHRNKGFNFRISKTMSFNISINWINLSQTSNFI